MTAKWRGRGLGGACGRGLGGCGRSPGAGAGPHQAECLRQLEQGLLGPLPGQLQFAQRVSVGPLAQPLREGAQTHEVALLLPLLLHRRDVEALQGRGEAGCREEGRRGAVRAGTRPRVPLRLRRAALGPARTCPSCAPRKLWSLGAKGSPALLFPICKMGMTRTAFPRSRGLGRARGSAHPGPRAKYHLSLGTKFYWHTVTAVHLPIFCANRRK